MTETSTTTRYTAPSAAYSEGYQAASNGRPDSANPFPRQVQGNRDWQRGHDAFWAQG